MGVVLDPPRAELLTEEAIQECGRGVFVSAVVILPGGKQIAGKSTAPMGRLLLVREVCIMAVQGRVDITEIPQDWAACQPEAIASTPELTGAALRIFVESGPAGDRIHQLVGVIGLLGVESAQAIAALTVLIKSNGFLLSSDLPQAGAQG